MRDGYYRDVSMEIYFSTSYGPGVKYLDGVLQEKPVVPIVHGRVQVLIDIWFENHRREWGDIMLRLRYVRGLQ